MLVQALRNGQLRRHQAPQLLHHRHEPLNLYAATDPNGGIVAASLSQGPLLAGVSLNASTGTLSVRDATALPTGSTSFTIRTMDAGGSTLTPLTLTFNASQLASVTRSDSRPLQSYANGDVLATYSGPDGSITSITGVSGVLPPALTPSRP